MRDACPRGPIREPLLFQAHLFPRTVGFSALNLKFPVWPKLRLLAVRMAIPFFAGNRAFEPVRLITYYVLRASPNYTAE